MESSSVLLEQLQNSYNLYIHLILVASIVFYCHVRGCCVGIGSYTKELGIVNIVDCLLHF